jgi:hypothetical protein
MTRIVQYAMPDRKTIWGGQNEGPAYPSDEEAQEAGRSRFFDADREGRYSPRLAGLHREMYFGNDRLFDGVMHATWCN